MTRIIETKAGRLRRVLMGEIHTDADVLILEEHIKQESAKIRATWTEVEHRRRAGSIQEPLYFGSMTPFEAVYRSGGLRG